MRIFRLPVRIAAVVRKELRELLRRPGAVLSLVLGPLIVMGLFGMGFTGERRPFEMVIVVPPGTEFSRDPAVYQRIAGPSARIMEVTEDLAGPRERLARGEIRMIVVAPADARQQLERGEQATLIVETDELDPIEHGAAMVLAETLSREINSELVTQAAREGRTQLGTVAPTAIKPELVGRPTRAVVQNRAPTQPSMLTYFMPAVLALVLQHLGITLTALSMVRERLSGAIDIYRVSPIGALELLVGKYATYAVLGLAVAFATSFVAANALGIPLRGRADIFAVAVVLLTFASLGVGLLISLVSDSERQAVQLAMLVLLVSVFFSGFVLPVHEFRMPVAAIAYALPVTYGIEVFQQEMLRGEIRDDWMLGVLGAIGAILFALSALRLRGVLRGVA
ncbi:MAG TPA: ABC transporter permease [Candidatus Limnocylindria bacterium]|nr:ABC transporter permease [Candidatus Limnocylindria bacterium]